VARHHSADEHASARFAEPTGRFQGIALMEPVLSKAARKLGIDHVAIHRLNSPEGKPRSGPCKDGSERM